MTPLHHALRVAKVRTAELLLKHGADVAATDLAGNTALHWALRPGESFTSLKAHRDGWQSRGPGMFMRKPQERLQLVKMLLQHGAAVNAASVDGRGLGRLNWAGLSGTTALHAAVDLTTYPAGEAGWGPFHGSEKIMEVLLQAEKIVEALLQGGSDVSLRNAIGETPMDNAKGRRDELVALLRSAERPPAKSEEKSGLQKAGAVCMVQPGACRLGDSMAPLHFQSEIWFGGPIFGRRKRC